MDRRYSTMMWMAGYLTFHYHFKMETRDTDRSLLYSRISQIYMTAVTKT